MNSTKYDPTLEVAQKYLSERLGNSHISVVQLAEELKVDRRTLTKVLTSGGYANVSLATRRFLASALNQPGRGIENLAYKFLSESLEVDEADLSGIVRLSGAHYLVYKFFSRSPSILVTHLTIIEHAGMFQFTDRVRIRNKLVQAGYSEHTYHGFAFLRQKILNLTSFDRGHVRQMSIDFGGISSEGIAPGLIVGKANRTDLPYMARVLIERRQKRECEKLCGQYDIREEFVSAKAPYLSVDSNNEGVIDIVNPLFPSSAGSDG